VKRKDALRLLDLVEVTIDGQQHVMPRVFNEVCVVNALPTDDLRSYVGAHSTPPYPSHPEPRIRELARGVVEGRVFCDRMVCDRGNLDMIFMPLVFDTAIARARLVMRGGALYANMTDTLGSYGVNGYPTFHTVGIMNREDGERFYRLIESMQETLRAMESAPLEGG